MKPALTATTMATMTATTTAEQFQQLVHLYLRVGPSPFSLVAVAQAMQRHCPVHFLGKRLRLRLERASPAVLLCCIVGCAC